MAARSILCLTALLALAFGFEASAWAATPLADEHGAATKPAASAQTLVKSVHLIHIEINQGIQDDRQTVGLLANKPTFVRVFFNSPGPTTLPITGKLTLSDPATGELMDVVSLGTIGSILNPNLNGNAWKQRQDIKAGLIFNIPSDWTSKQSFVLQSVLLSKRNAAGGEVPCDNCKSLGQAVTLISGAPLKLRIIALRYRRGDSTYEPRDSDINYTVSFLRRTYPAGEFDIETRKVDWNPPPIFEGANINFGCDTANLLLLQIRKLDLDAGGDPLAHYYGMVFDGGTDINDFSQFMRGCASVIPSKPDPSAVASGPAGTHQPQGWHRTPTYGDWYAAHEIGHTFGRSHVGTTCGDQPADKGYQDFYGVSTGVISNAQHQYIALDRGDDDLDIPMQILSADTTHDSMTYCANEWLGAYNYEAICSDLNGESGQSCGKMIAQTVTVGGPQVSTSGPAPADNNTQAQKPYLALSGSINYTKNTATFYVDPTTTPPPSGPPPASNTVVELHDAQNSLIATYPVVESYSTDLPLGADRTGNVSTTFPFNANIARVVLIRNGTQVAVLGSGQAPQALAIPQAATPSVKDLTSSLGIYSKTAASGIGHVDQQDGKITYSWDGSPQSADTKYDLQVSLDNGKWRTVGINLSQTSTVIDPTWITGANKVRLRVIAVNGIHHQIVTSDDLDIGSH